MALSFNKLELFTYTDWMDMGPNLLKSLIILLETTKLLLAQSAASFQCAHPFLLSPFPLPTLMNPLCGEIVIQVDYTVNCSGSESQLQKCACHSFDLYIITGAKNYESFGEHLSVVKLCR